MSENKEAPTSSVFSGIINKGTKANSFSNGNIGIPIKITLDINIGGKSEKIPFTSSLLYIPPEEPSKSILSFIPDPTVQPNQIKDVIPDIALETYPRIPMKNERLPASHLKQLRYKEVVQFFFNKNKFAEKMEKWGKDILSSTIDYINPIANIEEEIEDELEDSQRPIYLLSEREVANIQIEKENIELMLHLLLPTYAFHSEGYKTSMHYWNPNEPYLKNTFPKTRFSYIRHNGKIYTISNAVWLNDVFNVPFYRELIQYYEIYKDWKTERIQYLKNEKQRIKEKKERVSKGDENQIKILDKEFSTIEQVLLLLQKNIMEKKELEELFKTSSSSKYDEVRKKFLKITPFSQSKNQLYIYSLLFSKQSNRVLSYSNDRLNEIIYNDSPPITNKNIDKNQKTEKNIRDKQLLEQMLENILDYAIHNGTISYLKRGICPKEGKENCHSSKEISTFYYTGIQYQTTSRMGEPSYEIYVLMDVIEGEVTKKNIAGIKCTYENQSIGKKLEYLTGQWPVWDLSNRRIFMRLDAKEETPLVSKTITDIHSNSSISANEQGEKRNINEDIQKRMEKWIEFDNQQTEHKLKNSLEKLKEETKNSDKSPSYMQKVKTLDWSFDNKENDVFLKWIQNPNKYPSPSEKETNDGFVAIDRKIYLFLEKMEVLFQSKSERTNKIRDITTIVEQLNDLIASIKRMIDNNESKITSSQWKYVKIIMEFYDGFLSFLVNFLEFKKRKYQQEGADFREGGELSIHALIHKTLKKYEKKRRFTRKLAL
jgi:hypothetical protein